MSLAYLSIQRVTGKRQPYVPSNAERVRAYRAYQPVQEANAMFAQRYAKDAAPGDDYDQDLRDGSVLLARGIAPEGRVQAA